MFCIFVGDLIEFYGMFGVYDFLCIIGFIFCYVSKIVFEDEYGVKFVLLFCKEVDDFFEKFLDFLFLFM